MARAWVAAWHSDDPARLGRLFHPDAVYRDLAFQTSFRGPAGVIAWKTITDRGIQNLRISDVRAFRRGQDVAIEWTFTDTVTGAPRGFSLPAATILRLRDGLIAENTDYYNRAVLLEQSGLPPDWSPPAPAGAAAAPSPAATATAGETPAAGHGPSAGVPRTARAWLDAWLGPDPARLAARRCRGRSGGRAGRSTASSRR